MNFTVEEDFKAIEIWDKNLEIVTTGKELVIDNQENYNLAAQVLKTIKLQEKAIKELLDPKVDEANKAHKEATAERNKYLNPLKEIETKLKNHMSQFIALEERKRQEEQRRQYEERQAQEALLLSAGAKEEAKELVEVPIEVAKVETAGISYRDNWKYTIVDPSQLPEEYTMRVPDEKKIEAVVKALKDEAKIPGVLVTNVKTAVVR
jgi:hypothetical protein